MTLIGMNLAPVSYYGTEDPFVDRMKTSSAWAGKDASGTDVTSSLQVDSNGYVINPGDYANLHVAVNVDLKSAAPIDEYVLTYSGTATVSITSGNIVSQTAGKVVFDYTGGDNAPYVLLNFTGMSDSNPLSNIHVVRSDQVSLFDAGEIFNPDFVAKVSQWGVVRFMDWGKTNGSAAGTWDTRGHLTDASWTTAFDGVPLEAKVQLANEAHVDMWINIPTKADDTYVTNELTYIRDNLDPGLKVHVEYSNEVWNTGFAANGYAKAQATALWGTATGGGDANFYYGYRSAQIASIAHQVFGDQSASRLVDVIAGQAVNTNVLSHILSGIAKAGLGSAASLFQDYAIAPYFGGELTSAASNAADHATVLGWANSGAAGLDAAFHELEYGGSLSSNQSLAVVAAAITSSAAAANAAGLGLAAYEGGASMPSFPYPTAEQATITAFFGALMNDPRMGDLYTTLVHDLETAGATSFAAFNDVGGNSVWGYWGALDSIYDSDSPRYDALLAAATAANATAHPSAAVAGLALASLSTGGVITGQDGNDTITAGSGSDTIDGGAGNDSIMGSSGTVDAHGALIESDYYFGGAGNDTIVGGVGNDHIYGNEMTAIAGSVDGADSLSGGAGNDYIQGNAGADTIDGGDGNDRLYGGADNDSITGGNGNDYLQGNKGDDTLDGGAGNDTIHGGAGNDRIYGGDGNDSLYGDGGIDTMTGGAGSDVFVFTGTNAAFATSGSAAFVTDEITDFTSGSDKIALDFHPEQLLAGTSASVSAAMSLAAQLLQAHAGHDDVAAVTVGSDTYLFYDSTGLGGALDSAIKLDGLQATSLSVADFV
jgi:Ca2+-binding RTX toxin-like protein